MATSKKAQTGVKVTKKTTVTPVKKTKKVDITLPKEKKGNMFDRNYPTTDRLLPAQNGKKMNPAKKTTTGGNRINTLLPGFVPPTDTRKGGMMPGLSKNGRSIKKSQNGSKVDANTKIQKLKLDNKYNKIYAAMKKDSTDFSNKFTLPSSYNSLRQETGKSPSAEELRKRTSEFNKALVKEGKKDKGVRAVFGKLDAKGRADNAMNKKNGGSVKRKMRNGGSLSGLTASNKRDKGIDPKGAYTTVQKRTLAGARGKAKLTADKQLGATKMKRGGMIKKK